MADILGWDNIAVMVGWEVVHVRDSYRATPKNYTQCYVAEISCGSAI